MPATRKPPSNALSHPVRKALEAVATPIARAKGATIFQQGDPPLGIYLVSKGAVRMTIKSGKSEILMRMAHEGSVLGLPGVMSDHAYSLTARAAQACELAFVEREAVLDLVRKNPAVGLEILQMLSEEVRTARFAMAASRKVVAAHA